MENLQRLQSEGVKWCWISSHANCSPRYKNYQGKLYSLFDGEYELDGRRYKPTGTIDGIPYRPINEALAGSKGDGNGCISGYNCRHRAIEYERGSKAPADFTEAQIKREYAIDKKQRAYENRIRQLKQEEKQLRACGMTEEAKALRKKWRILTKDYQIYSIEHDRAYYPYRYVIDRTEVAQATLEVQKDVQPSEVQAIAPIDNSQGHIFVSKSLGQANPVLMERFDIKSESVIITDRQYKEHIATGANHHDDIFERVKDHIPSIIEDPDYIFQDDKREDTVILFQESIRCKLL